MGGPFAVAALSPFGEVLFVDGPAREIAEHGIPDFGEGIEPDDEPVARVAVEEAAIQEFADFVGETGDFSDPGCVHRGALLIIKHFQGRKAGILNTIG